MGAGSYQLLSGYGLIAWAIAEDAIGSERIGLGRFRFTFALTKGLNVALNRHKGRDLPASVVKQYAEHALKGRGIITYSGHVKQRMREREFGTQDVQYVLETGTYSKGFWAAQEQNHEFNVSGFDLNGEELEVSCAVISPVAIKIVTGKRPKYE